MKKQIMVFSENANHQAIYEGVEQALNEYFYTPQETTHFAKDNLKLFTLKIEVIPNETSS